ncbi:MAG: MbcA/ParS/Xre antitoxin family protein [Methylococcales bacterium]
MTAISQPNNIDDAALLSKATLNAGKSLGLKQTDISEIIGKSRSRLSDGIDPKSNTGKLALYLVRIYRSLYALVSGDNEEMVLWMKGENKGTGGIPIEQIKDISGLVHVMEYLDAMRGKV